MKNPSINRLQLKVLTHYYGLIPVGFFCLVKPRSATSADVVKWHNKLVSIADFFDDYGFFISTLLTITVLISLLIFLLVFFFGLSFSDLTLKNLLTFIYDVIAQYQFNNGSSYCKSYKCFPL